jgi:AraC family transcriptional regulator
MAQATAPILDSTFSDMPTVLRNVCFRGQSGKHILALRFSGFVVLTTSFGRRQLRKQFCAFFAQARFHTA